MGVAAALKVDPAWFLGGWRINVRTHTCINFGGQIFSYCFHSCARHDIVRDFTLAAQVDSGLNHLQRRFITILNGGADAESRKGALLCSYISECLYIHVKGALGKSLSGDDLILSLLDSKDRLVAAQSYKGVPMRLLRSLLSEYETTNQHWAFGKCAMNMLRFKGLDFTMEEKGAFVLDLDNHLQPIQKEVSTEQALFFEAKLLEMQQTYASAAGNPSFYQTKRYAVMAQV